MNYGTYEIYNNRCSVNRYSTFSIKLGDNLILGCKTLGTYLGSSKYISINTLILGVFISLNYFIFVKNGGIIPQLVARFTLDGLPGKMISIENNLNAKLIDKETAKTQKAEVTKRHEKFCAFDGVFKIIQYTAIVNIILTVINIICGVLVLTYKNDLYIDESILMVSSLAIGDIAVSYIPVFIVYGAILIELIRLYYDMDFNLIKKQLFKNIYIFQITAFIMMLFTSISGIFNIVILSVGITFSILGLSIYFVFMKYRFLKSKTFKLLFRHIKST